jgi:quercetin dioxygenase-like cupin family protein
LQQSGVPEAFRHNHSEHQLDDYRTNTLITPYALFADVCHLIEPPVDGTLSRTIWQDEHLKAVLFAFSVGQELSEHTASSAAIMHFLLGKASITLGSDRHEVEAGSWVHMPPQLPHSIRTKSPVVMLLLLLKGTQLGATRDSPGDASHGNCSAAGP